MKRIFFTCFGMLITLYISAQLITIKDAETRRALEFVAIYDIQLKTTVLTNPAGQASISLTNDTDSLYLRLIGYEPMFVTLNDLKQNRFKVYLKPSTILLQPFEVSAIRWQQGQSISPGQMQLILPAEIAFQNPQTSADMLNLTGNIFTQKSQLGGGSPMIRGFAANRVLIVVDGVRMNNAIFRSGNLQNIISVDPFLVERTEVFFGPSSVAFGSDAIGGVMSFTTFEPGFSATDKTQIFGKAMTRWSSANNEKTVQLNMNIALKKWAFLTIAGTSDFDDLKMGSKGPEEYLRLHYAQTVEGKDSMFVNPDQTIQKFSGYTSYNLMQKIRFKPNEKLDLTYTFMYNSTGNIPRYDRLLEYKSGVLKNAEWYYGPQKWMMHALSISLNDTCKLWDKFMITAAYQNFEESRHDRKFNNNVLRSQIEKVSVISANLDFSKRVTKNGLILYGLESMLNSIGSTAHSTNIITGEVNPTGTRYPDGSEWNSFAAYALYKQKVGKRLSLPIGARYTHVIADAEFDTSFYALPFTEANLNTGTVNGSAGLIFRPDDHWQFTINLTTGFRAPNIDDMGKVFESEPGSVVVPNPHLKPEYAYSGEAGVIRVFGKRTRIEITGFYTHLKDALVRRDYTLNGADSMMYDGEMSRIQAIQNAAFAYVYGISANLEIKLPAGFGFYGTFNWQKGEEELDDGSRAPLRHVAPMFGMGKLTFTNGRFRSECSMLYNGSISNELLAPSEREKPYMYALDDNGNPWSPSWYTINFRAGMELTSFMSATAGIENLLDVRYRPYSSGITAAGRNIVVSLQFQF